MRPRRVSLLVIVVVFAPALGCAGASDAEQKEADVYMEAEQTEEPEPKPPVVPVPVAQPSPGQMRPQPPAEKPSDEKKKTAKEQAAEKNPDEIIDEANRKARETPVPEGYYNAIQQYDYTRGMLYQVYCARNKVTAVRFAPGETVKSVALGDTTRWIIGRTEGGTEGKTREIVLVKPVRAYLETNMTVTTDRRIYQLELHSYKESYMASVSWNYPRDLVEEYAAKSRQAEKKRAMNGEGGVDIGASVDELNFDYRFVFEEKGDLPRWMPRRVFDNGNKTFIQFPDGLKEGEAPALFVLSNKGEAQIANYRSKGDYYVVDRLFDVAELRMGKGDGVSVGIERRQGGKE